MNPKLNVWAMQKDMSLKVLLIEWQHRYGAESLRLNLCEQNFQAVEIIALEHPKLSAYIYTFAQLPQHYGIDLKYPIAMHNIIGENENQNLEQIIAILQSHLFF
jgi:hypothetical protein